MTPKQKAALAQLRMLNKQQREALKEALACVAEDSLMPVELDNPAGACAMALIEAFSFPLARALADSEPVLGV